MATEGERTDPYGATPCAVEQRRARAGGRTVAAPAKRSGQQKRKWKKGKTMGVGWTPNPPGTRTRSAHADPGEHPSLGPWRPRAKAQGLRRAARPPERPRARRAEGRGRGPAPGGRKPPKNQKTRRQTANIQIQQDETKQTNRTTSNKSKTQKPINKSKTTK